MVAVDKTSGRHDDPRGRSRKLRVAYLELDVPELVCVFLDGSIKRLPLSELGLEPGAAIVDVSVDEFGAGLLLGRADGTLEDYAADLILYKVDPEYRSYFDELQQARDSLGDRLGHRLRAIRTERGLSLRQMAELLQMAAPNYTRLEGGHHQPNAGTIHKVAALLGIPVGRLVGEKLARRPAVGSRWRRNRARRSRSTPPARTGPRGNPRSGCRRGVRDHAPWRRDREVLP